MSSDQRITETECNEAWAVFSDREKYLSLSDEQTCMVEAFITAGQIFQETGAWPTLQDVEDKWQKEAAERAQKRDAMIAECAALRAKQKA
jgi:hypothetical protein